jgi:hypothetical protein
MKKNSSLWQVPVGLSIFIKPRIFYYIFAIFVLSGVNGWSQTKTDAVLNKPPSTGPYSLEHDRKMVQDLIKDQQIKLIGLINFETLKQDIYSSDEKTKLNAIDMLSYFPEHANILKIEDLLLNDTSSDVRNQCVRSLEILGSKSSIPFLISALNDKNKKIRIKAALALAALGEKEKCSNFITLLWDNGGATAPLYSCHLAFVDLATIDAIRMLIFDTNNKDKFIALDAAINLAQLGYFNEALPVFISELTDNDKYSRIAALRGLAYIGSNGAVELIKSKLNDRDPLVRKNAAMILKDCNIPFNEFNTESTTQQIGTTYNPVAAANYADKYTDDCTIANNCDSDEQKHNPAYPYIKMNDCANFVSQCLIEGGLDLSAGPGEPLKHQGCIIGCNELHQNLTLHQNTTYSGHLTTSSPPASFVQGDVAIFGNNSTDYWKHACIAATSGPPLLDAHTNNRIHKLVSYYYPSAFSNDDFYHISTSPTTYLAPPILTSPPTSANNQPIAPTFTWQAVPGASSYRLMIAISPSALPNDPTAGDFVGSGGYINAPTTGTGTSYIPTTNLNYSTTYYWEVHARSADNYGTWSSISSFTTGSPASVLLVAPASFSIGSNSGSNGQIGLTSNVSWTGSTDVAWLSVSPTNGSNNGTVTVTATSDNMSTSPRNGTVTISGGGITRTVAVTQNGSTATPSITVSTASLFGFGSVPVGTNSSPQSFTVLGNDLTSNILITAPVGFQVSLSSNIGFGSSITLTQSGGTVSTTTIYSRFCPTMTGYQSGNISLTSSGAVTKFISMSGTGSQTQYSITLSSNPSNGGTTGGGGSINAGTNATVTAAPNNGYTFSNWTENGSIVSSNASYSFWVNNSRSLVANFTAVNPTQYIISLSSNPSNGGTTQGNRVFYQLGQQTTVVATSNPGYTFINWSENGNPVSTNSSYTFNVTTSRNLVANFTSCNYTLNSYSLSAIATATSGAFWVYTTSDCNWTATTSNSSMITLKNPNGAGNSLVNFDISANQSSNSRTCTITVGGQIFTVTQNGYVAPCSNLPTAPYSLRVSIIGSNVLRLNWSGTIQYVSDCQIERGPSETGPFTVIGSTSDYGSYNDSNVVGGTTYFYRVKACCTSNCSAYSNVVSQQACTFSVQPTGIIATQDTITKGQSVTLTVQGGYAGTGTVWTWRTVQCGAGPIVGTGPSITITPDTTRYYVVKPEGGNCMTSINCAVKYIYVKSSVPTLLVSTSTLPDFGTITIGAFSSPQTFSVSGNGLTANLTLTAPEGFQISQSPNFFGPQLTLVPVGGTVPNTIIYAFYFPTISGNQSGNISLQSIGATTKNVSVSGKGIQPQYLINLTSNPSNGGITAGGGFISLGSHATVSATPNSGFTFTNWTEGASVVSLGSSFSFTVGGPRNLVANFTVIPPTQYSITLSSNPSAGGTTSGGGAFNAGSNITITATPNSGYTFTSWTENGNFVSSSSSYPITVNSNRTLVANFTVSQTCTPVTIATQPQSQSVNPGTSATFTVTVNGAGPFSYYWYKNGTMQTSTIKTYSTTNSYTTQLLSLSDNSTYYHCYVLNCNDNNRDTTTYAYVTIIIPPTLSVAPVDQPVDCHAGSTMFTVKNTGTGTMKWSASSNQSWAVISSGSSGTNSGTIKVDYTLNNSKSAGRTATICVIAPGAVDSSQAVTLSQSARSTMQLLYLKVGNQSDWTFQGKPGSQSIEIQEWEHAGYSVITQSLDPTVLSTTLLAGYDVLRLNTSQGGNKGFSIAEATALYSWVNAGGKLFADIVCDSNASIVKPFGVNKVGWGENPGYWVYGGSPLRTTVIMGPFLSSGLLAFECMNIPSLDLGSSLIIAAMYDAKPAIVYGQFGSGKVVINFTSGWSHDAPWPNYVYCSDIGQEGNLAYLQKSISYLGMPTSIAENKKEFPVKIGLHQNYPNPFNPTTNISFELELPSYVDLNIYNLKGDLVRNILSKRLNNGLYQITLDASNMSSGVYFYSLTTETYKATKRMLLIK